MATKIGDMAIYISANTSALARDLARASNTAASFASGVSRRMASLGGSIKASLGDVFKIAGGQLLASGVQRAVGGMYGLVDSSLKLAAAAEVTEQKFSVMLGSMEDAKSLAKDLRAFAAVSPVSVSQANESAASLIGVGVKKEQVVPTLSRLSDLASGDPESLKSLIRVYGQIKGMGKLQGQDWLQIANTNTLTIEDMAKSMGVTTDQFMKLREQGRVSFYDVQKAIKSATDEGGRFYKMGEKYAGTYAGNVDKLGDSWDDLKRYVGQAIIDEMSLKQGADDAGNFIDSLRPFVDLLRPAIRWIGELGRAMAQLAGEGGKAFLDIADIIGGRLARAFPQTIKWIKEMVGGLKEFKLDPEGIANFAVTLGDGIVDAIQWARPYWDSFVDGFVIPIKDAITWVVETLADANKFWAKAKDFAMADGKDRYGAVVRSEQAAAERRTNIASSMNLFGLDRGSAGRLVDLQGAASAALQKQVANEGSARMMRSGIDSPNTNPESKAFYKSYLPEVEASIAASKATRAEIDAKIQEILKAANPKRLSPDAMDIANRRKSLSPSAPGQPGNNFRPERPDLDPRLADLANKLTDKLVNPATKFANDMKDLETIRDAGRLTSDQFALATQDLMQEAAGKLGGPAQLASGIELGSQQLATMVARAAVGQGPRTVEGLLDALNRTQQQALDVARQQLATIGQTPPVVTLPE